MMPFKSLVEEPRCQVVRTLDVVGEKWSLLIIRNALRGQTRFSEFRDQLGIPSDILTARLATLVAGGVLEKRSYREVGSRERFSYHLTEAGRALNIVIAAMIQWGDEYNPSPHGQASIVVDAESKDPLELEFVGAGRSRVTSAEVGFVPGPASTVIW
jgi:DNA-binding HxlR family transcriptional regulator